MAKKKSASSKPKEKKFWNQVFCDFRNSDDAELFMLALIEESGIKESKLRILPFPQKMGIGTSVVMSSVSAKDRECSLLRVLSLAELVFVLFNKKT